MRGWLGHMSGHWQEDMCHRGCISVRAVGLSLAQALPAGQAGVGALQTGHAAVVLIQQQGCFYSMAAFLHTAAQTEDQHRR